jgi:hypothetical protein
MYLMQVCSICRRCEADTCWADLQLQAIDGFNTKKIHDQPAAAKLNPDDAKAELWQERTYVTISDQRNPPELIAPGAKVCDKTNGIVCESHLLLYCCLVPSQQ